MDLKSILIYLPKFPVLTETFIARDIEGLLGTGRYKLNIVALERGTGEIPAELESILHIHTLTLGDCIVGLLKFGVLKPLRLVKAFTLVLGKDQVPFIIPAERQIEHHTTFVSKLLLTRFALFLKGIAYANIFAKYAPDELVVHFAGSSSTMVMVAACLLNKEYVLWAHARDVSVDGSLIKAKVKSAKSVIVCNKYAYDEIMRKSGNSAKVVLQYHGLDHTKFSNQISEVQKPAHPLILTVGRLVEKKGLYYLIRAAEILKARGEHFITYIIGAGPLYSRLLSAIDKHNVSDVVTILGKGHGLPFKEVVSYMAVTDVFVFPGIVTDEHDFDGITNSVIEASLMKVPSVVTTAGSNTELIKDNYNGFVVPQRDPEALANALQKLIKDPNLRQTFGKQVFEDAKDMFDMQKTLHKIDQILS